MRTWSLYDSDTGLFTGQVFNGSQQALAQNTPAGCSAMPGAFNAAQVMVDVATGEVVQREASPQPIAELKAAKVAELRARREARICGGFSWGGHQFDSDQVSQTRILGLFLDSQSQSFTTTSWRLADNSWLTLNATDIAGVWAALKDHIRGNFDLFATLEAQVNSSSTALQISQVAWPA